MMKVNSLYLISMFLQSINILIKFKQLRFQQQFRDKSELLFDNFHHS